ncbi:MAG: hypothetical protein ACK5MQ_11610 [Pikeienuella sp.]
MEKHLSALGGVAIAVARRKHPDWAFAALVFSGGETMAHVFQGRAYQSTIRLKNGAEPDAHFAALAKLTAKKTGLFKRAPFHAACVAVRRRGQKASLRLDFENEEAFAPLGDNPRRDFGRVIGDAFPDEARAMFRENLPPGDCRALVGAFIRDYKLWNDYAFAESRADDPEAGWNQGQSYDNLILRYCSSDKTYQGLAFSSDSSHCPAQEAITGIDETGDEAEVRTRFRNANFDFISHGYAYQLKRRDGAWRLSELWLCDEDGRHPCL